MSKIAEARARVETEIKAAAEITDRVEAEGRNYSGEEMGEVKARIEAATAARADLKALEADKSKSADEAAELKAALAEFATERKGSDDRDRPDPVEGAKAHTPGEAFAKSDKHDKKKKHK